MSPTKSEIEFLKVKNATYKVLRKEPSINPSTLQRYREEITTSYNDLCAYINSAYHQANSSGKASLDNKLEAARQLVINSFNALGCVYKLPDDIYEQIDLNQIGDVPNYIKEHDSSVDSSSGCSSAISLHGFEEQSIERISENRPPISENPPPKMDAITLFNAVNRQFKSQYSGEPLGLQAFLDSVNILETFANTPALHANLFSYVKTKLEGRAREFITPEITTLEQLKLVLTDNIKPENSKVVEGRISALHYAYSKQEEFVAKAEQLSDALRRTLIVEGISAAKANEMVIEKTVELCRKSTQSDLVKSVLASTAFKSPKEVIAKLITESDNHVKEQKILRYNNMTRGQNSRGRGQNNRGKYNRGRGNYNGYYNGNYNSNNGYNNNQNGQQNYQNNRGNGYRGRGNTRGRYNGGYRQNNQNQGYSNQNNNYQGHNNYNGQNIRVAQAGNGQPPQEMTMGAQQQEF